MKRLIAETNETVQEETNNNQDMLAKYVAIFQKAPDIKKFITNRIVDLYDYDLDDWYNDSDNYYTEDEFNDDDNKWRTVKKMYSFDPSEHYDDNSIIERIQDGITDDKTLTNEEQDYLDDYGQDGEEIVNREEWETTLRKALTQAYFPEITNDNYDWVDLSEYIACQNKNILEKLSD